jgi:hypothetical protein
MLESLWAIRFLKVSDAEAPEDVKATLDVFHLVEDGVEAVLESVRLQELGAGARTEKQTGPKWKILVARHRAGGLQGFQLNRPSKKG